MIELHSLSKELHILVNKFDIIDVVLYSMRRNSIEFTKSALAILERISILDSTMEGRGILIEKIKESKFVDYLYELQNAADDEIYKSSKFIIETYLINWFLFTNILFTY